MPRMSMGVPHPGEYIREELEARDMTATGLARILGAPQELIDRVLSGQSGVDSKLSKALGVAFDVSPRFFANLQRHYDKRDRRSDPAQV